MDWMEVATSAGTMDFPIICPIKLAEAMLKHDTDRFHRVILGEPGDIPNFWYNLRRRGVSIYERNKHLIDVERTVALKLHADGAPTTKADGLMTVSWSSLHGKGATKETRQVFAVIFNDSTDLTKHFRPIGLGVEPTL
jgi:hypothetical protein